ncbi:24955_t:CDS:2 [Cetraspora pellucida]|uniref:24955_t:CDS:1 n=1 Tax=Cetraspora pellucida TaxID=1433469 RepID=A0A9N8W987_9GLOM|nr:24955_t:CDS:2 [Cetraspora pellucida]
MNNKFANTQELVRHYLKNCIYFKQAYNNPEVKAFFKFLYPLVKLLLQKDLSSRILEESVQKINISIQEAAQKDTNDVTLAYDSWKNIKKESIFGSILITSMGKVLIWNAEDISDECTRTCAALKNLATKIEEGNNEDLNNFSEIFLTYISNNEW